MELFTAVAIPRLTQTLAKVREEPKEGVYALAWKEGW